MTHLVGAAEIAERLGLAHPQTVHTLRRRHSDFPPPVASLRQALVWSWTDIEAWADRRMHERRLERDPLYRAGFEHAQAGGKAGDNPLDPSDPTGATWSDGWRAGSGLLKEADVQAIAAEIADVMEPGT